MKSLLPARLRMLGKAFSHSSVSLPLPGLPGPQQARLFVFSLSPPLQTNLSTRV